MSIENKILKYFSYQHLPEHLQEVSKPFYDLAVSMLLNGAVEDRGELGVALRHLLEAKDSAVRAMLK